jgi:T-complex protein 1 subunit theta
LWSPDPCCAFFLGLPAAGASALVKLQAPQADELGFARQLAVQEIGGTKCIVLQQDSSLGQISTVVLRGSTDQVRLPLAVPPPHPHPAPPPNPTPTPTHPLPASPPPQMLDDVERAVDDGVNSYKLLGKDPRAVPAGGAAEVEVARQLQQFGRKVGLAAAR